MLSHILRAALQWALFLPLRVTLILLGFLVVPLALPFMTIENPPIAFTQAPGYWGLGRLPAWAWLWSNDRDGALGDKRGWWHMNTPFDLGAYHWFSQFWWLAIRNPANKCVSAPGSAVRWPSATTAIGALRWSRIAQGREGGA
ncbi:hypothetical protein [Pseudomonas sp. S5D5]|uniref:DUF7338 family protein n=1 Tax=Pseudomonas sp. S5D5 TaxID=2083056 RepID=UPI000D0FF79E|nr:hypothetical protein [Pseudomonas sp. S5D5]